MLIYRWKSPSLVASAELEKRMDGYWATLRFSSDIADPARQETLKDLPRSLSRYGVGAYADVENGQHVLRLTTIGSAKELLNALTSTRLVTDEKPAVEKTKDSRNDPGRPRTLWEKVKKYATRLRGISGLCGDVFLFLHQKEENRLVRSGELDAYVAQETELANKIQDEHKKTAAIKKILDDEDTIRNGASANRWLLAVYVTQACIHTFFGAGRNEVQFDELMGKVKKRTAAMGGELNGLAGVVTRQRDGGGLHKLYLLFRNNSAMFSETIPLFGNWQKIRTGLGLNKKRDGKNEVIRVVNHGSFWTGVSQAVANIIGAYVPEQTKESIEAEPNAPWYKKNAVYQWIAARPTKIQNWICVLEKPLFQIPTVINLAPKLTVRKRWHSLETNFYTIGRLFGAVASKNSEKPNHLNAFTPAFAMAANLLAGVPEEKAETTIGIMSQELAQEIQREIGQKVDSGNIAAAIRKKLEELQGSPFVPAKGEASAHTGHQEYKKPEAATQWVGKHCAKNAAGAPHLTPAYL